MSCLVIHNRYLYIQQLKQIHLNTTVELSLSGIMILYVLIEIVRINFLKKDNNDLLAGLISVILLLFGIYLSFRYGLKVDYTIGEKISESKAELMPLFALLSVSVAMLFILISIIKFAIWQIRKTAQQ